MARPSPDRLAVLFLAILGILVVAPALLPGRAFVSVHSAVRKPFDLGLTEEARKELTGRGNFETGDQLFQVLPERIAFLDALRGGEIPLWWREAGGGISLMGAPGGEFTEPRVLLFSWLLGPVGALAPLAALSIFVLAAMSYLFFRLRGRTPLAAAGGSVAFALAGALTSNLFYVCKVDALILLPAGLAALELWLLGRRALAFSLAAIAAADSALASFPQNTAIIAYALLLLGALRLREAGPGAVRAGAWLGLALALGLSVGAFHLFTVAEWGRQSDRPFSLAGGGYATTPPQLLGLLAPFVLGDPTSALCQQWNPVPRIVPGFGSYNFTETTLYVGLAGLALAAAGAFRGRAAKLPLVGLILTLAMAMGTPAAWLPGVGVSAPSRALASVSFFLAWLAADGLDAIVGEARPRRALMAALAVLGAVAAAALALRSGVDGRALGARISPENAAHFAERWNREIRVDLLWVAIVAGVSLGSLGLALARPRWRWLAVAVLTVDLGAFALHVTPSQPSAGLLRENPTITALKRRADGGRIVRIAPDGAITSADFETFQATLPPAVGLADTAAYVVMPNAVHARAIRALFPADRFPNVLLLDTYFTALPREALTSPILDLLGASLVVSRAPLEGPGLEPVARREGFCAYRRTGFLGRAWIVPKAKEVTSHESALAALREPGFDPRSTVVLEGLADRALTRAGGGAVSVRDVSNREVAVSIHGTAGGFLVDSDAGGPGWTAFLDGGATPIFRANGAFRAIEVPAGDHEVRFVYGSRAFRLGAAVSLVSLAAIPILGFLLRRRGRP